jgi:catechol 2,3-dioxygenase-like lactoylglutathione lyase family enzyme
MSGYTIDTISLPVSDPNRSKAFYMEQLGFELVMDHPFGHGLRWVMLRPPGGGAAVTLVTWFETMPPGSLKGTVLRVDDIESAVADLCSRGAVGPEQPIESAPWGRFVTIEDPDGNSWVVQQSAEGPIDFGGELG